MSLNPLNYSYDWSVIVVLIVGALAFIGSWLAVKSANKANELTLHNIDMQERLEIIRLKDARLREFRLELAQFNSLTLDEGLTSADNREMLRLFSNLILMVDPQDPDCNDMIVLMSQLVLSFGSGKTELDTAKLNHQLTEASRKYLKKEWDDLVQEENEYNAKNK